MDDQTFDRLTRLIASGASRRSILKGLLGLGGTAVGTHVAVSEGDARGLRTRRTLPPPPPPPSTTSSTTPAPLCASDQDQCPGTKVCCPAGTCTRSGNQAVCCDGTNGAGNVPCGLDCCDDPNQCCDGECCATGSTCLTQVFAEGPFVEEETCCPTEQTCDERCCEGSCFTPLGTADTGFARSCCPPEGNLCQGTSEYADVALCCAGERPDCCTNLDGSPVCLTIEQCCQTSDCLTAPFAYDEECVVCELSGPEPFTCQPIREGQNCGEGECDVCAAGQCQETPCPTTTTTSTTTTQDPGATTTTESPFTTTSTQAPVTTTTQDAGATTTTESPATTTSTQEPVTTTTQSPATTTTGAPASTTTQDPGTNTTPAPVTTTSAPPCTIDSCVSMGYDEQCIFCSGGVCTSQPNAVGCATNEGANGFCDQGQCAPCLGDTEGCNTGQQCCSGSCVGVCPGLVCDPPGPVGRCTCSARGDHCVVGEACCDGLQCIEGRCTCNSLGNGCSNDDDCCEGEFCQDFCRNCIPEGQQCGGLFPFDCCGDLICDLASSSCQPF